jgi:hypothetical protein
MTIETNRDGQTRVRLGPVEMWIVASISAIFLGLVGTSLVKLYDISERVSRIEGQIEYMNGDRR